MTSRLFTRPETHHDRDYARDRVPGPTARARTGRPPTAPAPRPCRCCRERVASRPRGLCGNCFSTPGVRERFPSTSKYANRGVGNGCFTPTVLADPTPARPGTDAKVDVLAARAAAGLALWHDLDGRI